MSRVGKVQSNSEDTGTVARQTDQERVLMQIETGSVDASADAARSIAARAEEQYGDVWVSD